MHKTAVVSLLLLLGWATAAQALVHPGVLNTQAELDFWVSKVAASAQPWLGAYNAIGNFSGYTPKATATLAMGNANEFGTGATALRDDCQAALGSTYQWFRTGIQARADKAKQILNHMADTVTGSSGTNAPLWWGFYVRYCVAAAELLKHATPDSGWSSADESAFATWLVNVAEPRLQKTDSTDKGRSNWASNSASSRLAIGIFADNQTLYNQALNDLRAVIRFYVGCQFDTRNLCGSVPASFSFELCRSGSTSGVLTGGDLHHDQYGFNGLVLGAEMAKHQGVDLYGYKHTTTPPTPADNMGIEDGLLYIDQWIGFNEHRSGSTSSGWPCAETLASNSTEAHDLWVTAGNHYRNSGQIDDVASHRMSRGGFLYYQNLTHNYGNVGGGGSPPPDTTPPSVPTGLTVQRDSDT
jgi:hypothetical protein